MKSAELSPRFECLWWQFYIADLCFHFFVTNKELVEQ